jgi:catechol 2,3-dioxygenase
MSEAPTRDQNGAQRASSGARIGHVNLKVSELQRSLAFYEGVLGFKVTKRLGDAAAFLSHGD